MIREVLWRHCLWESRGMLYSKTIPHLFRTKIRSLCESMRPGSASMTSGITKENVTSVITDWRISVRISNNPLHTKIPMECQAFSVLRSILPQIPIKSFSEKAKLDRFSAVLSPQAGKNFAPYFSALKRALSGGFSQTSQQLSGQLSQ